MRLLWISTKPPWPPVDGGRLAQALTLEALVVEGVRVTVVAPAVEPVATPPKATGEHVRLELVETRLRPMPWAVVESWLTGRPVALLRHDLPAVRRRVEEWLETESFDAVHVEQLHAWAQAEPARRRGVPCLLRTQNVESDLWRAVGSRGGLRGWLARREARGLAKAEGRVVREASAAVALTPDDAERLSALAGGRKVVSVPPPFPSVLPASEKTLAGDPPVVVLSSGGWWPNLDADAWLRREIWPRVAARVPGAVLHRFGGGPPAGDADEGVVDHGAPDDSREAYPPQGVLLVPLRIGSGIRMKILESWARGVPVVATPRAAAGLGVEHEKELLLATDAEGFATAVERLVEEPALRERLIREGRRALEARYDGPRIARRLMALYKCHKARRA